MKVSDRFQAGALRRETRSVPHERLRVGSFSSLIQRHSKIQDSLNNHNSQEKPQARGHRTSGTPQRRELRQQPPGAPGESGASSNAPMQSVRAFFALKKALHSLSGFGPFRLFKFGHQDRYADHPVSILHLHDSHAPGAPLLDRDL